MAAIKTYGEIFPRWERPVLLATPQNICYATGFYTTARRPEQIGYTCALLTRGKTVVFCPQNWAGDLRREIGDAVEVCPYQGGAEALALQAASRLGEAEEIGLDMTGTELELYLALAAALPAARWVDVTGPMQRARLIKTPAEVAALRASAEVAKAAMECAKQLLRPGKTEWQVVAELEYEMRRRGSDGTPFTMKVLTGEHAVQTWNVPDDRPLRRGEIVLLDFGATVQHYASDWTRSFVLGQPTPEQQALYDLVWQVERACLAAARPGATAALLMQTAYKTLEGQRFAPYFNPYLGHSIGLKSQEWPPLRSGTDLVLEENMVLTIEPGIYVPGVGGVRIEDEILIRADGAECLTGLQEEGFRLEC